MNHDLLKTVIYDQHEVIKNFHIVNREYEFDLHANYVVTGRQYFWNNHILRCLRFL